jgi:hypothetical protein
MNRLAVAAIIVGLAAVLTGGYALAGPSGLAVTATALTVLALLAARGVLAQDRPPPPFRPDRLRQRGRRPAAVRAEAFAAYRRICAEVSWSEVSRRHYDHMMRPLLARLLYALAADRDIAGRLTPERAREIAGEELWPLIDTSVPPADDSRAPGVDLTTVARIVTTLEQI